MSNQVFVREEIIMGNLEDFRAVMHEIYDAQSEMKEEIAYLQGERTPSDYPPNMARWEVTLGGTLQKRGYIIARQIPNEKTKLQFTYFEKFKPIGPLFEVEFVKLVMEKCNYESSIFDGNISRYHSDGKITALTIRDGLISTFNISELKDLCFNLDILFESLPGRTINEKARELVEYCYRHSRIDELLTQIKILRPNTFPEISINSEKENALKRENISDPNVSELISLEFSEDELYFLYWVMKFIEGGIGGEDDKKRAWMEFKLKKHLVDYFGFSQEDFYD